jgi:hypothetical protein
MGRFGLAGWLLVFGVSVGCGGIASRRGPSDDGESGGSAAGGSSAMGGSVGSGVSGPSSIGNGSKPNAGGSSTAGTGTCLTNSGVHELGDTFTADDGCNICKCERNGHLECTDTRCPTPDACKVLEQDYSVYLSSAAFCTSDEQCSTSLPSSVWCGCPMWVNATDTKDVENALLAQQKFQERGCSQNVPCPSCAPLSIARCLGGRCLSASGIQ